MVEKYQVHALLDYRTDSGEPHPGMEALHEDENIEISYSEPRERDTVQPEELQGADAAISSWDQINRQSLDGVDSLELVVRTGAGFDNLDIQALSEHGIVATHAPQGPKEAVAQCTLGMIIVCAHKIKLIDSLIRTDLEEAYSYRSEYLGHEIQNKTLGLIGLGQIGKRVVELLDPFGMNIQAYDPYVTEQEAGEIGVNLVSLTECLATSDFISIHVPLTEETRYMLGREEFREMKDTAYLINTSRGGIYRDEILASALQKGWIAGAAIDVFEEEPPGKENPLLEIQDILLTPHISGRTPEGSQRLFGIVSESIIRMKDEKFPNNILNPKVYDVEVPSEYVSPAYKPWRHKQ